MMKLVLCIALLGGSISFAADWPAFRGPDGNGFSPETGLNKDWNANPPKELWRVRMTDGGYGGPAVAGGKLFIIDHAGEQDVIRALDMSNGKDLWRFTYPDMRSPNNGFTRATPCVSDGKVYTVSSEGKVHCLDAQTGKPDWMKDLVRDFGGQKPQWGYSASVVVDGNTAILCPGGRGSSIVGVDRGTGKLLWQGGDDKAGYATPAIGTINGVKQYIVFSGTGVYGYTTSGKELWNFPWKTSYDVNAAMPIVVENGVFISSGYNTGCAMIDITPEGARQRWRNKVFQQHFSTALLHNGMLYGSTDPGDLVCVDPKTGSETWRHGGVEKGGVMGVEGMMIAINGRAGDVLMVELTPQQYKEAGRIKPLAGQSWTAPIIADGKLIVRDTKQMVCLSLKQ